MERMNVDEKIEPQACKNHDCMSLGHSNDIVHGVYKWQKG